MSTRTTDSQSEEIEGLRSRIVRLECILQAVLEAGGPAALAAAGAAPTAATGNKHTRPGWAQSHSCTEERHADVLLSQSAEGGKDTAMHFKCSH